MFVQIAMQRSLTIWHCHDSIAMAMVTNQENQANQSTLNLLLGV